MLTWLRLQAAGLLEVAENIAEVVQDKLAPQPEPAVDLAGTRAIVTGGNAGVGLATAEALASHGANVVLACRSIKRGQAAAESLSQLAPASGCKQAGSMEVEQVDLMSLSSVNQFCQRIISSGGASLLVLNAGIMAPPQRLESIDGFEAQFQSNYLAHWLMANRLVKDHRQWRQGQEPQGLRIVFLSSLVHHSAFLDFEDLQAKHTYDAFAQYAASKLACILAAKELQRRLDRERHMGEARDVAVAAHPGIVNTYLARTYFKQGFPRPLRWLTDPLLENVLCPAFFRTPTAAARLVLKACTAPNDVAAGQYYAGQGLAKAAPAASDEPLAHKLWQHTRQLCIDAGCKEEDLL